jgi:hypothetical protein
LKKSALDNTEYRSYKQQQAAIELTLLGAIVPVKLVSKVGNCIIALIGKLLKIQN